MKKVPIPITSPSGAKDLTPDQRNLLIILEDATLMYARDEISFLRLLPEITHGPKLTDSYCADSLAVIDKRMRQIRRLLGSEKAEQYEASLLDAVDGCDEERAHLKREIRAALVQKVRWQDIDRAEHIATACGLLEAAQRAHTWITGKRHTYAEALEALGMVDSRLECRLLNEGSLPQLGGARLAFAKLFDRLCAEVLDKFTKKQTENQK